MNNPLSYFRIMPKRRPVIRLNARAVDPWINIVASNGQILMTSETYSSLGKARRAAITLSVATGLEVRDVKA